MANASEILLLGAARYPGLANFSISAANSVGVTTASLLPPGRSAGRPRGAAPARRGCGSGTGPGRPAGAGLLPGLPAVPPWQTSTRRQPPHPVPPLQRPPAPPASAPPEPVPAPRSAPRRPGAGGWSCPQGPRSWSPGRGEPPAGATEHPGCQQARFYPAPDVRAHLQSAECEQRRDLAVSGASALHRPIPGTEEQLPHKTPPKPGIGNLKEAELHPKEADPQTRLKQG
ncbi:PREDICTED: tetratricopeptide repeat protein 36 isoform X1 [Calidris pugnax]|uniref:tetratricopeptide repeat protein 36 isoform X1 n=1 Tax=Calidris pugnax TaxID=198806 RepID=UPI00071E536A|nr:PREDICTED: tetratricopeptide repeat protein 36 isoform X1 [Calidris pugnax]